MPVIAKPQWELFAQASARGLNAGEAYLEAYPNVKKSTAHSNGHELLKNTEISGRISELQSNAAKLVEWELADAVKTAHTILFAKPDDADGQNPLAEQRMSKAGPYYVFPSKMTAFQELAKLKKLYPVEEMKHSGSVSVEGLGDLLGSICKPGLPHRAEVKPEEPAKE